jgi:integrase
LVHKGVGVANGQFLRRRGTSFYFRLRWPPRLANLLGKRELILHLGTTDRRLALHRARITRIRVEQVLTMATPKMTREEAERLVREWVDRCLWRQEIHAAKTDGYLVLEREEAERMGPSDAAELDLFLQFVGEIDVNRQKTKIRRALTTPGGLAAFAPIIAAAAAEMGIPADLDTADGRLLARAILRGYAELVGMNDGRIVPVPDRRPAPPTPEPSPGPGRFLDQWEAFVAAKLASSEWQDETAAGAATVKRLFDGLAPDATISDVFDTGLPLEFRTALTSLPRNYDKNADWKGLTFRAIIQATAGDKKLPRIKPVTVNKHLTYLLQYCDYLSKAKLVSRTFDNPFSGLLFPRKRGRAARDDRKQWPLELDRQFFSSPVYSGCASFHRRAKPGSEIHRDALFWVPIIGRTTGTRLDEICSRQVGDVTLDEIPCLRITDSKTTSSTRDVPIPRLLLDLGFLEHRVIGREPTEPLFPELTPQGTAQRRSTSFSKRYGTYRKLIKVNQPKIDFHSYRSNVETELKNISGVNSAWIDELLGHESSARKSEGDRYTKLIYQEILWDTINKVTFPVDMSHLYYDGKRGYQAPGALKQISVYAKHANQEINKKKGKKPAINIINPQKS